VVGDVLASFVVACRLRLLKATSGSGKVDVLPEALARSLLCMSRAEGVRSSCCMTSEVRFLREEEDEAVAFNVDMIGVCSRDVRLILVWSVDRGIEYEEPDVCQLEGREFLKKAQREVTYLKAMGQYETIVSWIKP